MVKLYRKLISKITKLIDKTDKYEEAITFAEAGDHEYAISLIKKEAEKKKQKFLNEYAISLTKKEAEKKQQKLLDEYAISLIKKEAEKKQQKLLVIGTGSDFSKEITDYALEMAQRMSYEIVAINTAPLEVITPFLSPQNNICQKFQDQSEKNVSLFQEEAVRKNISFSHVVKFSNLDKALEEIKKELKDIVFVVSEINDESVVGMAMNSDKAKKTIIVFSMV